MNPWSFIKAKQTQEEQYSLSPVTFYPQTRNFTSDRIENDTIVLSASGSSPTKMPKVYLT